MKKFLITFFVASTISASASANSAVLGLGLDSCSKVIENVENNDDLGAAFKTAYTSYVMGFFSGVNVVYEDDTGLEGYDGLYSEILTICKATPDASFISAIINLYAQLKK
ncbi:MAG: hypothetical protein L7U86_08805 [Rhodobacteraceae bacterium]|nr:hypothetical protein [Paracoccaceae bacterium]